jgi:putative component of toxin-antitoxin plasmid stabilization module
VIEIRHYVSHEGKDVFDDWLTQLADARTQAKIATRINRELWRLQISAPGIVRATD